MTSSLSLEVAAERFGINVSPKEWNRCSITSMRGLHRSRSTRTPLTPNLCSDFKGCLSVSVPRCRRICGRLQHRSNEVPPRYLARDLPSVGRQKGLGYGHFQRPHCDARGFVTVCPRWPQSDWSFWVPSGFYKGRGAVASSTSPS